MAKRRKPDKLMELAVWVSFVCLSLHHLLLFLVAA